MKKIKTLLLVIIGVLLFTQCQNEDSLEIQEKTSTINHLSLDELNKKSNFSSIIQNIETAVRNNTRDVNATDNSFIIKTDLIYKLEHDSITNYTFLIERPVVDSLKVENIIISKNKYTDEVYLTMVEMSKETIDDDYSTTVYTLNNDIVNTDFINTRQVFYYYGRPYSIADCAHVSYDMCDGKEGASADGHAATSACHGSAVSIDYGPCQNDSFELSQGGQGGGGAGTGLPNTGIIPNPGGGTLNPIGGFVIIPVNTPNYYGSFLLQNGFIPGTPERDWLDTHFLGKESIKDYLAENENSEEAQNFINQALEILIENPDLDFETIRKMLDELDKRCQALIVQDAVFIETDFTNTIFESLIEPNDISLAFFDWDEGDSEDGIQNVPIGAAAITGANIASDPIEGNYMAIAFSNNYLDTATDLGIFTTTIHEMLHAYLYYQYHQGQLPSQYSTLKTALDNYMLDNENDIFVSAVENECHNVFVDYIDQMAESVLQYSTENNLSGIDLEYAKKLVWGGLYNTEVFENNLTTQQQLEAQTLIAYEHTNHTNAKGTKSCD